METYVHFTSHRMTCKHANYFRATERRASKHAFRLLCVSAGRLVNTPRVACHHGDRRVYTPSFLGVTGSRLGGTGQKALQTSIKPTLFVDFCLIPLSNTCSFVRPARNVNREIFIHCQEGFCVGKFGRVVDQAVLENRPLRKHFRWSRLR